MQPELTIDYAPRHMAISAFIGVVATPPTSRYAKGGRVQAVTTGAPFRLAAKTRRPPYPTPTHWVADSDATSIARIPPDLRSALLALWSDVTWLLDGDSLVCIRAHLTSDTEREALLSAYAAETGQTIQASQKRLAVQWAPLHRRLLPDPTGSPA